MGASAVKRECASANCTLNDARSHCLCRAASRKRGDSPHLRCARGDLARSSPTRTRKTAGEIERTCCAAEPGAAVGRVAARGFAAQKRSEEHTSELPSLRHLV